MIAIFWMAILATQIAYCLLLVFAFTEETKVMNFATSHHSPLMLFTANSRPWCWSTHGFRQLAHSRLGRFIRSLQFFLFLAVYLHLTSGFPSLSPMHRFNCPRCRSPSLRQPTALYYAPSEHQASDRLSFPTCSPPSLPCSPSHHPPPSFSIPYARPHMAPWKTLNV